MSTSNVEDCRCGETMTHSPCLACGNTTFTIAHPYHHNNTDFIYGIHKGCIPRLIATVNERVANPI